MDYRTHHGASFDSLEAVTQVATRSAIHLERNVRIWRKQVAAGARFCITDQNIVPEYAGQWAPVRDVVFIAGERRDDGSAEARDIPADDN